MVDNYVSSQKEIAKSRAWHACMLACHACTRTLLLGVLACLACLLVQVSALIMVLAIKKELYMHKCMLTDVSLEVEIIKNNKEFLDFNFSVYNHVSTPSTWAREKPSTQARKQESTPGSVHVSTRAIQARKQVRMQHVMHISAQACQARHFADSVKIVFFWKVVFVFNR